MTHSRNRPYYSLNNEQLRTRVEIISNASAKLADTRGQTVSFFIGLCKYHVLLNFPLQYPSQYDTRHRGRIASICLNSADLMHLAETIPHETKRKKLKLDTGDNKKLSDMLLIDV
jgi:hypothetical protein